MMTVLKDRSTKDHTALELLSLLASLSLPTSIYTGQKVQSCEGEEGRREGVKFTADGHLI